MWDTNAIAHQYILRKAKGEFLFQTETQPMYIKQLDSCWSCTNKAAVGAEASAPPVFPEPNCSARLPVQVHSPVQCAPASRFLHAGEPELQPDLRPHLQYRKHVCLL